MLKPTAGHPADPRNLPSVQPGRLTARPHRAGAWNGEDWDFPAS